MPYKNGGELMLEANFGKEEYLSVKWVFRNFFVIDAIQFVTACKSEPAVFLHADSHFSTKIVKEKLKTIDIRENEALNNLKILVGGAGGEFLTGR